jgi:hypothetical protein
MADLFDLPKDLPVPTDDGACNHLQGKDLPSLAPYLPQNLDEIEVAQR